VCGRVIVMSSNIGISEEEQKHKKSYWQNELKSLGIDSKRKNEFNDREELESLADNIKRLYYRDYKTAYSTDKGIETHFG
jgi:hypothetical protein